MSIGKLQQCLFAFVLITVFSCGKAKEETTPQSAASPAEVKAPAVAHNADECIKNFEALRKLLLNKEKEALKNYFSFPAGNSMLWTLVANRGGAAKPFDAPFTEADYNEHFDLIFNKEFLDALKQVNAREVFEKELYITDVLSEKINGEVSDSYMEVQYYKDELVFAMNYRTRTGDVDSETGVVYFFSLDAQCNLQFRKVEVAG